MSSPTRVALNILPSPTTSQHGDGAPTYSSTLANEIPSLPVSGTGTTSFVIGSRHPEQDIVRYRAADY